LEEHTSCCGDDSIEAACYHGASLYQQRRREGYRFPVFYKLFGVVFIVVEEHKTVGGAASVDAVFACQAEGIDVGDFKKPVL